MKIKHEIKLFLSWLTAVYMLSVGTAVQAAEMVLSDSPLFLGTQISPNIFFMLDDSGSMDWEILTQSYHYYNDYWTTAGTPFGRVETGYFRGIASAGSCNSTSARNFAYVWSQATNTDNLYNSCSSQAAIEGSNADLRDWRVRNAYLNIMYYNPTANYSPWNGYSNATFTNVRSNPVVGSDGYTETLNLTGFKYDVWIDDHGYSGSVVDGFNSVTDTPNGEVDLWDSHVTYTVDAASVTRVQRVTKDAAWIKATATNCTATHAAAVPQYGACYGTVATTTTISGAGVDEYGRTVAEIQQNVANWYQYHRRRSFAAKAAISTVISANTNFRFGISLLNDYGTLFVEVPDELVEEYDAHNDNLLDDMFEYEWRALGTPLRQGLEVVGRYYSDFYSATKENPIISSCQQNYTVLFTDGYWSTGSLLTAAIGDEDGDGYADTLADVAKYFYDTDLNASLPNDVPTSAIDQNDQQHMVSFTVAFGVDGYLVDTDNNKYPDPALAEDDVWGGDPFSDDLAKIDDLWHAAFNSKGYFVSAQSASGVAQAIADALLEIGDRIGSAASVATNTGSLNAGSHLFQARFDSSDWKGQLLAFQINLDGTIDPSPDWEAGSRVNAQHYDTGREIITRNPSIDDPIGGTVEGKGVPFRFPASWKTPNGTSEIDSAQVAALLTRAPYPQNTVVGAEITANQNYGAAVVNYLRGDTTNEASGLGFRNRSSVLGDIVNSDPKFVSYPNFRYPANLETVSYASFRATHASRPGVVYAGANDGMLHAFSEDTGDELLAYVPGVVYENLWELTDNEYEHRYFVDAGPNIIDVYFPSVGVSGAWKTLLAGGLNGGGQGIYALDITDPSLFDEANAASIALWEFDDSDDVDLGYTYGKPQMAKMANGQWAAIFGNGYNNTEADGAASTTGHAVLYIVDVETGNLIKKIDTEAGAADTPNGLATPLLIDDDGDFIVDYVYAGDLLGNMWKFDVDSNVVNDWDVAYQSGGNPIPLFTTDANQPITAQPMSAAHPDNFGGSMIYFGTGKYLEINDNDPFFQTTQAFYGIWDKNEENLTVFDSSDLVDQSITNQYMRSFDTDNDGIADVDYELRDFSNNAIDYASGDMGWVFELRPHQVEGVANVNNFGERQVTTPILRNGRIIFTTLVPSSVECEFGGKSFLMELDFRSGGALGYPAFDLNGDGEFDADDTNAGGRASDVGIMPSVSIMGNGTEDIAYGSGASGDIDITNLSLGNEAYGRQSWRQIE